MLSIFLIFCDKKILVLASQVFHTLRYIKFSVVEENLNLNLKKQNPVTSVVICSVTTVIYQPQSVPHTVNNNWLSDHFFFFVYQVSELSDLTNRPLVGALTSRLQALHAQLQVFVERVDSLGKPPEGGKEPHIEGECPVASNGASPHSSGDNQDGLKTVEEKVNEKKHIPPFHILSLSLSC